MPVAEVLAAGAVLWRPGGPAGVEIALVHRPRYDDWSLPKGKVEPGETMWATAAREVAEETGFSATLGRKLGRVTYPVATASGSTARKVVDYVAARARSGRFLATREVDALRWMSPAEAANLLTYPDDVRIVHAFTAHPTETVTVALLRHAKAGQRSRWPGPDHLRPLSSAGWTQVKALRRLLPLFGVDRVHSAPLVRCSQTVQQLADDLDTTITEEPLLSEQGFTADPPAAVARLRSIVTAGGTPVICSQGGVIPHLLTLLADPPLDHPESRKASTWLLTFTPTPTPRLLTADYIPRP